jgi:hypothetical protein
MIPSDSKFVKEDFLVARRPDKERILCISDPLSTLNSSFF